MCVCVWGGERCQKLCVALGHEKGLSSLREKLSLLASTSEVTSALGPQEALWQLREKLILLAPTSEVSHEVYVVNNSKSLRFMKLSPGVFKKWTEDELEESCPASTAQWRQ